MKRNPLQVIRSVEAKAKKKLADDREKESAPDVKKYRGSPGVHEDDNGAEVIVVPRGGDYTEDEGVTYPEKTKGIEPIPEYQDMSHSAYQQKTHEEFDKASQMHKEFKTVKSGIRDKPTEAEVETWLSSGETPVTKETFQKYDYITVQDVKYYTRGKTYKEFVGEIASGSMLWYEDPKTGAYITGSQLKIRYFNKEVESSIVDYKDAARNLDIQALTLPKYVRIKGSPDMSLGSFKLSIDPVHKEQVEWKKLDPHEQFAKAFYVGATRFPELVYSKIPVIGSGRIDKLQQKWMVEEGSLWDKAQRGDKGAVWWDALTSPTMQEVYITLGTMGLIKAAGPVTRRAISGGLKTYGRVTRFIPDERLFTKGIKSFGKKVIRTEVGGNIYKWAAKGYRFGYEAGARTVAGKTISGRPGLLRVESVSTKTIIDRAGKRVLLSPKQYEIAKQTLKKLTSGPKTQTRVGFQLKKTSVIVESKFKRSFMSSKLFSKKVRITGSYLDEISTLKHKIYKYGSFYKHPYIGSKIKEVGSEGITKLKQYVANFKKPMKVELFGIHVTKSKTGFAIQRGYARAKDYLWVGYKKLVQPQRVIPGTRRSKISAFRNMVLPEGGKLKGIYKTVDDPIRDIYAKGAKVGAEKFKRQHPLKWFIKDTSAYVKNVTKKSSVNISKNISSSSNMGKLGLVIKTQKYIVPVADMGGKATLGLRSGLTFTVGGMKKDTKRELEPIVYQVPDIRKEVSGGVKPFIFTKQDEREMVFPVRKPVVVQAQKLDSLLIPVQVQEQKLVAPPMTTVTPLKSEFEYGTTLPSGIRLPFRLPSNIYGSGSKQPSFAYWGKIQKYRERKTFNPLKGFKLGGF